jgi:tRNA (Thr-GGU) A37 N-methylase
LQIVSVDAAAGVLVLGGVDIVDGSPVLDIKPYVPFSDSLPDAVAPDWVTVRGMLQLTRATAQAPCLARL